MGMRRLCAQLCAALGRADFTDFWNDATGNPIHSCAEDMEYCPDVKTLENMKTMSIWAEGIEGDVHLEVQSISGYGCQAVAPAAPVEAN